MSKPSQTPVNIGDNVLVVAKRKKACTLLAFEEKKKTHTKHTRTRNTPRMKYKLELDRPTSERTNVGSSFPT